MWLLKGDSVCVGREINQEFGGNIYTLVVWILYQLSHKGSPRILEWVLGHFSCVQLSVTPWTMALQAPLSMGFSRQEYWSGLPFPSPVIKCEVNEVKLLSHV